MMQYRFKAMKVGRNYVDIVDNYTGENYTVTNKHGHLECGCPKGHNCVHEGFALSLVETDFWRVLDY